MIIWFTGQPGAGKTTLADALYGEGVVDHVVDGDDLRELMPNPGYGEAGRIQNIDRAQAIAAYLHNEGYRVAVALVSPYRAQREQFKKLHPVIEVYLTTDEDDIRGREHFHVEDYEPPEDVFYMINTSQMTVAEATAFLLSEVTI